MKTPGTGGKAPKKVAGAPGPQFMAPGSAAIPVETVPATPVKQVQAHIKT